MSLFGMSTSPQQVLVADVDTVVNRTMNMLASANNQIMRMMWNNPQLTPQQAFDVFSTSATAILQAAQLNLSTMQQASSLLGISIPTLMTLPSAYSLQPNQDGTVTVTVSSTSTT